MNYKTFRHVSTLAILVLLVSTVIPVSTSADDWYDGGYDEGITGGGYDGGFYGGGYDGWYDGGYNEGLYGGGYDEGITGGGYDGGFYGGGYDGWYDAGYDDGWYDAGYDNGWYDAGYRDDGWYDAGYSYEKTYYDYSCDCYSYSSPGYNYGKSYSYPSYSSGYSVKPVSFGSPSYPVKSTGGSSSSHSSVSNTNVTNTTITNVDNSIKDSFNNYNSGNVTIVGQATPQYPIVYTAPAPYCQIYQAQASGSGVTAVYLSWSSSNATSAYLSNVGSVSVNGSKTVWPTGSQTYTLTVYGSNGQSAECRTTVSGYSTPYVSLTQIPYTGFDFGTLGNAMYWAGLVTFALGAGYLAVYYIPGVAFAGVRREKKFAPVVAPIAPILAEKQAETVAPIVHPVAAAIRKAGTLDTMAIVASKDGSMPKIVISRE